MTPSSKANREPAETEKQSDGAKSDSIPLAEWIAAAIGLVLLTGSLWVLLSDGLDKTEPPSISVEVNEVTPVSGAWLVRFTARNRGDETVAGLRLVGTLSRADTVVETADVQLDYVPGRSVRRGGLFLSHDPASGKLEITPSTFSEP